MKKANQNGLACDTIQWHIKDHRIDMDRTRGRQRQTWTDDIKNWTDDIKNETGLPVAELLKASRRSNHGYLIARQNI